MPELPDSTPEVENATSILVAGSKPVDQLNLTKYSTLRKLVRVIAWVRRFVHNAAGKIRYSGELSASELTQSQDVLVKLAQSQFISEKPDEFKQCQSQFGLFTDKQDLLRCSGRLDNADLPYDARYPVFLPSKSWLSELIVKDRHELLAHSGVPDVLASIRSKYWLPKGRSEIRRILHQCRLCKLLKGGAYRTPNPPPLPAFRAEEKACFASVGLDYLGPLMIRSPAAGPVKVWICLFTCCNTRAVHLEVVKDMTTEQFLLCLRRFIASYGAPHLIVCDNAKQFHSGKKVTDKLWNETTEAFCSNRGIVWKFIVEYAPWFGGFYERMVGIVKKALRSMLHNQLMTLVELQTICLEGSYIVNSRPLTYCEDEVASQILCPNDFIARSRLQFPSVDVSETPDDPDFRPDSGARLRLKWRRLDRRLRSFWDQWRSQYIVSLRETRWKPGNRGSAQEQPSVGTVVLIKTENQPRASWSIGRIAEVVASSDGIIRSAKVKLSSGKTVQRPLKLLCPLEVPEHSLSQVSTPPDDSVAIGPSVRPQRLAASKAKAVFRSQLHSESSDEASN